MYFGSLPIDQVENCILVHSLKIENLNLKKGHFLSGSDIADLRAKGVEQLIVARLDHDDVHEDPAAESVANGVAGTGVAVEQAFAGRANLIADTRGLLIIDTQRLLSLNQIDESITVATLPAYTQVEKDQLVATAKIIPFAAPQDKLNQCLNLAANGTSIVRIAPFESRQIGFIQTQLPGGKDSVLDKTKQVLDARLATLNCPFSIEIRCEHQAASVADAIGRLRTKGAQLIIISGASAIMDRRDDIPSGIAAAGGIIDHFGMPVDPGNLLLLAHHGEIPILGMPGCARSSKLNGFDWVLQRLLANQPVASEQIMAMGVGGLLKEIPERPQPRTASPLQKSRKNIENP